MITNDHSSGLRQRHTTSPLFVSRATQIARYCLQVSTVSDVVGPAIQQSILVKNTSDGEGSGNRVWQFDDRRPRVNRASRSRSPRSIDIEAPVGSCRRASLLRHEARSGPLVVGSWPRDNARDRDQSISSHLGCCQRGIQARRR